MSLSLMTMMGFQRPTRHEKYVMEECIKIVRYNKYPADEIMADFEKKHNESLDGIIQDLKKVLARPTREDRVMITTCEPIESAGHCRCIEVPMPTCKEINDAVFGKKEKK